MGSRSDGLPGLRRWNSLRCLHYGAPLPSLFVAFEPSASHAWAGGARSRAISDRISWNICRDTATASDVWAVFPTRRPVSAKARAFTMFIERHRTKEAGQQTSVPRPLQLDRGPLSGAKPSLGSPRRIVGSPLNPSTESRRLGFDPRTRRRRRPLAPATAAPRQGWRFPATGSPRSCGCG